MLITNDQNIISNLNLNIPDWVHYLVGLAHHRCIHIFYAIQFGLPRRVMQVAEDVHLRPYLLHLLPQHFAPRMSALTRQIQNAKGRPVSHQNIDPVRQSIPDLVGPRLVVLEPPIVEQQLIGRSEYSHSLDLGHLMVQISAHFPQFLYLGVRLELFVGVSFGLVLEFVVVLVEHEVVVAGDDHLVLVGQLGQECHEPVDLAPERVLGEVARVDEDVGLGQLGDVDAVVRVVRVTHRHNPHSPPFHCYLLL